jgi:hypothetical protein
MRSAIRIGPPIWEGRAPERVPGLDPARAGRSAAATPRTPPRPRSEQAEVLLMGCEAFRTGFLFV